MTDSRKTAVLVATAGGYFLGRTRKAKLALALASLVAGRRLGLDPKHLLEKGVRKAAETPQFEELTEQVRDQLADAARTAVSSLANRRIEALTDALRERTDRLSGGGGPRDRAEDEDENGDGEENGGGDQDEDRDRGEGGDRAEDGSAGSGGGAGEGHKGRGDRASGERPRKKAASPRPGAKSSSGGTGRKSPPGDRPGRRAAKRPADRSARR
ncbi:hypothetical protein FM076_22810 [Streptomyces albus subsp. chlorinus]|uniref:hypothetical protein n=1 Tax=Streptomyces albus TaxID=1888 RepID=UPI00157070EE|nr:hypothetical protein [Streptomyces albus]NSC23831.1 hypothetical protein [Streptomyces albus subsp. chlorinus]